MKYAELLLLDRLVQKLLQFDLAELLDGDQDSFR